MVQRNRSTQQKGIIAWFAANHVAANLLMLLILFAGAASLFTIRKQTTPDFELNTIEIRVPYLGAAPQEVEEGVVIKVEEAIQDVQGIVEMRGFAREGLGSVTVKVSQDADLLEVLNEVKTRDADREAGHIQAGSAGSRRFPGNLWRPGCVRAEGYRAGSA